MLHDERNQAAMAEKRHGPYCLRLAAGGVSRFRQPCFSSASKAITVLLPMAAQAFSSSWAQSMLAISMPRLARSKTKSGSRLARHKKESQHRVVFAYDPV